MQANGAMSEWRQFWFVPLAASLGYSTSVLHVYSLGPFIDPLQHAFGWSRAQISSGLTVAALVSGLFCIPIGMLVDKMGPRVVGLAGALLMCGSYALLGTATGSTANWMLLWLTIAAGTFGVQATVWTSAVATRFVAARGMAFALTLSGASVAATVFPILAASLIDAYGWRTGFAALGGLWAALVFPVLFFCFRGARDGEKHIVRLQDSAVQAAHTGLTLREGFRSAALYKLLAAGALFSFTAIGVVVHFVPILTDRGADPLAAAGIASLVGIFSIIGRLGTGLLLDRFPGHWVGAAAFLIPIIACLLLLLRGGDAMSQAAAAAIFGLTVGSEVDVIAYLAARHFGLKNFGALYGALVSALAIGTAFGPLAAGAIFDRFQSYEPFLLLTIGLTSLAAVVLVSLGRGHAAHQTASAVH